MSKENSADIAIVGAGIIGLAHAYMALKKGYKVVLFEREQYAIGASVRNFGMVWPIGQAPESGGLERALRSRQHWLEVTEKASIWINPSGSLHVVYHDDEWEVLNEFVSLYKDAPYQLRLLSPEQVLEKSPNVNKTNLKGGLWSATECVVNPREAVRAIPRLLTEQFGLVTRFGSVVKEISLPIVKTARETWHVDKIFICNGADFETLYPEVFDAQPIKKCKLQMMKAVSEDSRFSIGPSLCAGLTLRHYTAFAKCPSLKKVDERYDDELMDYKTHGIHVLLSQNNYGELIIGDSHHYGRTMEPFDEEHINKTILNYLHSFINLGDFKITERWHGIYPKVQGSLDLVLEPHPGVVIVNGLGGNGMTLSFGLAEEVTDRFL